MNLLKETREDIKNSGHNINDIIFIGSEESGHQCTWEEFNILADFEYDNGYGAQEVATDLIIVFSDGSKLWRSEYDGSEGWSYNKKFIQPIKKYKIKSLFSKHCGNVGWTDLKEINEVKL